MTDMQQPNDRKAPFVAPKLQIYGHARDITRAVGLKGNKDLGIGKTQIKTQLFPII